MNRLNREMPSYQRAILKETASEGCLAAYARLVGPAHLEAVRRSG